MLTVYLVVQICLAGFCNDYSVESYALPEYPKCVQDARTIPAARCEVEYDL